MMRQLFHTTACVLGGYELRAPPSKVSPVQCDTAELRCTLTLQMLFLGRHHFMSGGFADSTGHI